MTERRVGREDPREGREPRRFVPRDVVPDRLSGRRLIPDDAEPVRPDSMDAAQHPPADHDDAGDGAGPARLAPPQRAPEPADERHGPGTGAGHSPARQPAEPPMARAAMDPARSPQVPGTPVRPNGAMRGAPTGSPPAPHPSIAAPDPLVDAVNRTRDGAAPLPVTLICGVPGRPGLLGPLFSHLAQRLGARRAWGGVDRIAAGHTMLANMLEATERQDLDGAVRYLNAVLLDDARAQVEHALFVPLWNLDPDDHRGWTAFQALAGLVTLGIKHRRCVVHLIATARDNRMRAVEREFDLVVPLEDLALNAYDDATRVALKTAAIGGEAPRERDLRLQLPVVQIRRQQDELSLGLRAPELEGPKGLGGLFGRRSQGKREEEQYSDFGRQALLTAFRWDPLLQYIDLTLLREDRGVRRSVLELKAERREVPGVDTAGA